MRYRHPELGFELDVPEGTELRDDMDGLALVALEPGEPPSGFRANLVVTVEEVAPATPVGPYTDASLRSQGELLLGHRLIDLEITAVGGGGGPRPGAPHGRGDLASRNEQWRRGGGSEAYTVTGSCATLDYAGVADGFREAAESLVPG